MMSNKSEETVSKFYNTIGWKVENLVTEDAQRWEDLRECAADYVSICRRRVGEFLPANGDNILDMASGPIQYPEYMAYSENFKKRWCVDLSTGALAQAKEKLGNHGVYVNKSFFENDFASNFFDATISLHTIYHMDEYKQADAVRDLIRVTKPGQPIVIVYGNPNSLVKRIARSVRWIIRSDSAPKQSEELYFFLHELAWWHQFSDEAEVKLFPWRMFTARFSRKFIPDNALGSLMFASLYFLQVKFPKLMLKIADYPIVVMTKR